MSARISGMASKKAAFMLLPWILGCSLYRETRHHVWQSTSGISQNPKNPKWYANSFVAVIFVPMFCLFSRPEGLQNPQFDVFRACPEGNALVKTSNLASSRDDERLEYSYLVVALILMEISTTVHLVLPPGRTQERLQWQLDQDECKECVASCEWSGDDGSIECICGSSITVRWDDVFNTFKISNYKDHTTRSTCLNKRKDKMEIEVSN